MSFQFISSFKIMQAYGCTFYKCILFEFYVEFDYCIFKDTKKEILIIVNKNKFNMKEMCDYTSRKNFQRTEPSLNILGIELLSIKKYGSIYISLIPFKEGIRLGKFWIKQNTTAKTIHIWRHVYITLIFLDRSTLLTQYHRWVDSLSMAQINLRMKIKRDHS